MPALNLASPLGRLFSSAGGSGPRRLLVIGVSAIAILGGVGLIMLHAHHTAMQSSVAKEPEVDPLPGGAHSNPYLNQLEIEHAQDQANQAAAQGQSSVAPMAAAQPADPAPQAPAVAPTPQPVIHAVSPQVELAQPTLARAQPTSQQSPQPTKVDDKQTQLYANAIYALFSDWSGARPPNTDVVLKPADGPAGAAGAALAGAPAPATQVTPASDATTSTRAKPRPQVLIPAGKGVYAVTKLAASSDQGGPVIVTAESGPIAGDEMTGTFERRGDRLVVVLNSLTLPDGSSKVIDALVIAPDTMETAVATSVDEHYVSRFALPVAAAFVAGLGQAIQQSNATVVASPLGGFTSQNHLNFNQQLGVAAGAAGSQMQNLLLQNAPKGPTVNLAANANVGVIFLKSVTAGDDQ